MIALRKVRAGVYATLDGRYLIERQDNYTECEHPLCETLHRHLFYPAKWHEVPYVAWHVWDTVRDDYAGHEQFDTKRAAHQWLDSFLARQS